MNAVIPEYNIHIMRACLAAGANYQDMASGQTRTKTIDEAFLEQMKLDDDFKQAGLCALLSTGMDPGVTNTFAGNAYEDLADCFEIRIKDYAIFESPVPLQVWSQETYYTDCAQPPLLFEDGAFKRVEIFGRREYYEFPQPFGRGCVICHDHEEVSTLPRLLPRAFGDKGLRYVDFKMGGPEDGLDADLALVASGMTSKYPVTLKDGSSVRPIDVFVATLPPNPPADELARLALAGEITDYGVVTVECVGTHDGRPATIVYNVFPPDIKWVNERVPGATSVSYGTSTPGRHLRRVHGRGHGRGGRRRGAGDPPAQRARRVHRGARPPGSAGHSPRGAAGQLTVQRGGREPGITRARGLRALGVPGAAFPEQRRCRRPPRLCSGGERGPRQWPEGRHLVRIRSSAAASPARPAACPRRSAPGGAP